MDRGDVLLQFPDHVLSKELMQVSKLLAQGQSFVARQTMPLGKLSEGAVGQIWPAAFVNQFGALPASRPRSHGRAESEDGSTA